MCHSSYWCTQFTVALPPTRPDGEVYRIVGFEVDPRTVASESLQRLKDGKCAFPSDPKVMELHKNSECNM